MKLPTPAKITNTHQNDFKEPILNFFKYPMIVATSVLAPGVVFGILWEKFHPHKGLIYGIIFTILIYTWYFQILLLPSFIFIINGSLGPLVSVICYAVIFYLVYILRTKVIADKQIFSLQRHDLVYSWLCPLCVLCQSSIEYDIEVLDCCQGKIEDIEHHPMGSNTEIWDREFRTETVKSTESREDTFPELDRRSGSHISTRYSKRYTRADNLPYHLQGSNDKISSLPTYDYVPTETATIATMDTELEKSKSSPSSKIGWRKVGSSSRRQLKKKIRKHTLASTDSDETGQKEPLNTTVTYNDNIRVMPTLEHAVVEVKSYSADHSFEEIKERIHSHTNMVPASSYNFAVQH